MERLGFSGDGTPHGMRATFSTHFNAIGASIDVIEHCLAHVPGNRVRAAYNRHAYRAEAPRDAPGLGHVRGPVARRFAVQSTGTKLKVELLIRRSLVRVQVGEPRNTRVSRLAPADFFAFWIRRVRHVSEILRGYMQVSGSQQTGLVQTATNTSVEPPRGGSIGRNRCGLRRLSVSRRFDPVLAHQFEEGAAVFLGSSCGLGDVATIGCQQLLDAVSLKVLDHLGLRSAKREPSTQGTLIRRQFTAINVDVSGLKRPSTRHQDGPFHHVLQLPHIARPIMNQQLLHR